MKHNLVALRKEQSLRFLNAIPSKQPKSKISKQEAEILLSQIDSASCSVFVNVVKLIETRGHLALGFNKLQDCLRVKVPSIGNSYISRLIKAAEIYLQLDSSLLYIDRVSEATFRPLQDITIEDAKVVWTLAVSNASNKITSRDIKRAIQSLNIQATCNDSKCKVIIHASLHKKITTQAKTILELISGNVTSKDEWQYCCKLLYKQLLNTCPLSE